MAEERLAILERRLEALSPNGIGLKEAARYISFLRRRVEDYPVSRQRAILNGSIPRIQASKNKVKYTLLKSKGRKLDLSEFNSVLVSAGTPGRI